MKTTLTGSLSLLLTVLLLAAVLPLEAQRKVVGYINTGANPDGFDYTRITHLNIAFENPDDAGNISWSGGNDGFVTRAHNNNVKVLVSLCGGGASNDATIRNRYFNLISPANRASFISKIVAYLNAHQLDGIDLDLEGPAINGDYNSFVADLNNALPAGKLLTAALAHDNGGNNVSTAAVNTFDFLNIMAYDYGWGQAVHHSTMSYATTAIAWWQTNRALPDEKVVLGVPFYGYTNTTGAGGISFASILSTYGAAAANQDTWTSGGNTIYYNGIPTIRAKTQLVVNENYGGVMIWNLAQDAGGANSLLLAIDQVIKTSCNLPAQPGAVNGNTTVTAGGSQTYSISAVSGATSYTWTLPSGWSGTSSSTSITATVGSAGGTISVRANNACGAGPTRTLSVSVSTSPNLAQGRPTTVSSVEPGTTFNGANAVDGNGSTRWSSNYSDPQWIYVDLGSSYAINRVRITWEAAYATAYQVQVSSDASSWTSIRSVTGNNTTVNDLTGLSGTGRYVRIYGTARNTQWGYSIFELEVYGTAACTLPSQPGTISGNTNVSSGSSETYVVPAVSGATSYTWTLPSGWSGSSTSTSITTTVGSSGGNISVRANNACGAGPVRTLAVTVTTSVSNLALNKPVTTTSVEPGTTFNGANAVDGNASTRWSSDYFDPQSITVDLGSNFNVNRVKITWEAAYGVNYLVQVSQNNSTWTTIRTVTGNNTLVNDWTGLSGIGRYVRIHGTSRNTQWGYSIFELEVYGTASGRLATEAVVQEETGDEFEVYPNPVKTQLKIRSHEDFRGSQLRVLDASGREHESKVVDSDVIDVSSLSRGLYILQIRQPHRSVMKKFFKE